MTPSSVGRDVEVRGAAGLHARPAADFATTAARFRSDIHVVKAGTEVDAKSVLMLLTLDVRQGDRVIVTANGPDAEQAVDTLAHLLEVA